MGAGGAPKVFVSPGLITWGSLARDKARPSGGGKRSGGGRSASALRFPVSSPEDRASPVVELRWGGGGGAFDPLSGRRLLRRIRAGTLGDLRD